MPFVLLVASSEETFKFSKSYPFLLALLQAQKLGLCEQSNLNLLYQISIVHSIFSLRGYFRQGCGHSRICRQCQFGGVDKSEKEHRVIADSGDKPKNRTENKRVKKTTASIPSCLLNLWSLAPPTAARAQGTRFLRQKPWREEIDRWLFVSCSTQETLTIWYGAVCYYYIK